MLGKTCTKHLDKCINEYLLHYSLKSYSQEGEDMVLRRLFEHKTCGFYIDVGAHHPFRFSNTYFFYRRNWRGINIDATPGSMNIFRRFRRRDINIEAAVSSRIHQTTYYLFKESALNTFDQQLAEKRMHAGWQLDGVINIGSRALADLLHENLLDNQHIDFLTIDTEGLDLQVLESNNWEMHRPDCVLVELLNVSLDELTTSDIYLFMKEVGYHLFAKTVSTAFFLEEKAYLRWKT